MRHIVDVTDAALRALQIERALSLAHARHRAMQGHHDTSIDMRLALALDLVHSVGSMKPSSYHRRRRRRAWTDDHLHRLDVDEIKQTARGSSSAMVPRRLLCVARAHAPFLPMRCMVLHAFDRVDADLAT